MKIRTLLSPANALPLAILALLLALPFSAARTWCTSSPWP